MAAKSADEARAEAMKSKRGLPKGGGKGLKGSNLYTPVSQATIDSIKKAGMTASLKKAATSKDASFVQGVRRMYGAERLAAAKKSAASAKPVAKSADAARAAAGKTTPAKPKMGANTVMAPSNPNRQNMPYKTPGTKPVQKDMYGNTVKSNVTIGAKKKAASTPSKSKTGYKAPTQKDMYGNKIK